MEKESSKNAKPVICYLFAANKMIRDINTKMFSFIELFDVILIPKNLGFFYASFQVGGKINNVNAGKSKTEIKFLLPSGAVFSTATVEGTIEKGDVEFAAGLNLLKFEIPGRYYFKVFHNGTQLQDEKKYYLDVKAEK